jgi:hypothetical protein
VAMTSARGELRLTKDELRELRLALALRITKLHAMDTRKMAPSDRSKVKRHIEVCNDIYDAVQKARGK